MSDAKRCPDCGGGVEPSLLAECLGLNPNREFGTCNAIVEFSLDDLAQHLRDSGQYAVIRMDTENVVALKEGKAALDATRDEASYKDALANLQYWAHMVCQSQGMLT